MILDDLREAQRNSSIIETLCFATKQPQGKLLDFVRNLRLEIEVIREEVAKLKEKKS